MCCLIICHDYIVHDMYMVKLHMKEKSPKFISHVFWVVHCFQKEKFITYFVMTSNAKMEESHSRAPMSTLE